VAISNKRRGRRSPRRTSDAVEILRRRYVGDNIAMAHRVQDEVANLEIARKIYDLRTGSGLSQRALAKLIGTTASVVCRLEDADYEGHSLGMLARIAEALDKRVEIRFVSRKR